MELPEQQVLMWKEFARTGGERGIRTLDTGFSPYNGLANRRLQPLGHLSGVRLQQVTEITYPMPSHIC